MSGCKCGFSYFAVKMTCFRAIMNFWKNRLLWILQKRKVPVVVGLFIVFRSCYFISILIAVDGFCYFAEAEEVLVDGVSFIELAGELAETDDFVIDFIKGIDGFLG